MLRPSLLPTVDRPNRRVLAVGLLMERDGFGGEVDGHAQILRSESTPSLLVESVSQNDQAEAL